MEREIKFRGKLLHSKEWTVGNLIIAKNGNHYIYPSEVIEPDGHHLVFSSDSAYWVDEKTVGQYTGLKDKNGVYIYEGDICLIEDYSNGAWFGCAQPTKNYTIKDMMDIRTPYKSLMEEGEVLGSIHDNPELIK